METETEIQIGDEADDALFDATVNEFEDLFDDAEKLKDFLEVLSDDGPDTPAKLKSRTSDYMFITPGPDIPVVNICSSDEEVEVENCHLKKPDNVARFSCSSLDFTSHSGTGLNISSATNRSDEISSSFSETHNHCVEITSEDRPVSPSVADQGFSDEDLYILGVKNISASNLMNRPSDEFSPFVSAVAPGVKRGTYSDEHLLVENLKSNEDVNLDFIAAVSVDSVQPTRSRMLPLHDENLNVVDIWSSDSSNVDTPSSSIEEELLAEADDQRIVKSVVTVPPVSTCCAKMVTNGIAHMHGQAMMGKIDEDQLENSSCMSEDLEVKSGLNPVKESVAALKVHEGHSECEETAKCENKEANLEPVEELEPVLNCDSDAGQVSDRAVCISGDNLKFEGNMVSCEGSQQISLPSFSRLVKEVETVSEVCANNRETLECTLTDAIKKVHSFRDHLTREESLVDEVRKDRSKDWKGKSGYENKEINSFQTVSNPVKALVGTPKITQTLDEPDDLKPNLVINQSAPHEPYSAPNHASRESDLEPISFENSSFLDFPLPSPPVISELEYDDEPLFPSYKDVAHLPSSLGSSLDLEACPASSNLAPLPVVDLSTLLSDLDSSTFKGSNLQPESKVSVNSTLVSDDKEIDQFNDSLLLGQEAESELFELPIGTSEKDTTRPTEGQTADDVPSWQKPWISTDDAENADNNDPEWDILRKLETDEERYRVVRQKWRQLEIPDPRRDLTRHNFRKPISQNVCKTKLIPSEGRMSRKRSRSSATAEENPSKRRRMLSCTTMYEDKIRNLQQQLDQDVEVLQFDHQKALQELSERQQQEDESLKSSSLPAYVARQQMNNMYRRQVRQVEDLQSQFDKRLDNLSRSRQNLIHLLERASREVLTFNRFYNNLGSTDEDHSVITDEEYKQFQETEAMYDLYDQVYTE